MAHLTLYNDAVELLQKLISIPSFSKQENETATALEEFLQAHNITPNRHLNNVWAVNKFFDPEKPSLLLNSHHDTVKPNPQYTRDPYQGAIEDGKLYGLGSNDAGGCLVSLIATFLHFYYQQNLKYNVVFAASAEEEISGLNGIEAVCKVLPKMDFGIVGEPTKMDMAIAEKGLIVCDCMAHGRAGHAAREEGENAIYNAIKDIQWLNSYKFDKVSEWLGAVKMSVTSINTENKAHNMVPSQCSFILDVRVTDDYTHEEVLAIIKQNIKSEINPRSMRMKATRLPTDHPIIQAGLSLGKTCYGSPTSSDKALMPFPAVKCGPGDSARSHTADEFIYLKEIEEGINGYVRMLEKIV